MKLMSRRVGILTAAAFALTAGVSVVSAQFVSTIPAGVGGPGAKNDCGCAGGGSTTRVGCFSCCVNYGGGGGFFSIDPANVRVCFSYCGLEHRDTPCRAVGSSIGQLPQ